jgi:hypothetical protein
VLLAKPRLQPLLLPLLLLLQQLLQPPLPLHVQLMQLRCLGTSRSSSSSSSVR